MRFSRRERRALALVVALTLTLAQSPVTLTLAGVVLLYASGFVHLLGDIFKTEKAAEHRKWPRVWLTGELTLKLILRSGMARKAQVLRLEGVSKKLDLEKELKERSAKVQDVHALLAQFNLEELLDVNEHNGGLRELTLFLMGEQLNKENFNFEKSYTRESLLKLNPLLNEVTLKAPSSDAKVLQELHKNMLLTDRGLTRGSVVEVMRTIRENDAADNSEVWEIFRTLNADNPEPGRHILANIMMALALAR